MVFCDKCLQNSYFESINIINPINNSLVSSQFFSKIIASVYDIELVSSLNREFSICHKLDDGDENCGLKVFDEHLVEVKEPGLHTFRVNICERKLGCFCSSFVMFSCCSNETDNLSTLSYSKHEIDSISRMTQWEIKHRQKISDTSIINPFPFHCNIEGAVETIHTVIGIKSAAINLELRNAIRATWIKGISQEDGYCIAFIIGNSSYTDINTALELETIIHHDVLLSMEIPVEDSYFKLPQKSALFMSWAMKQPFLSSFQYMVICDDDVYLNINLLSKLLHHAPSERFYAGEVFAERLHHDLEPQRHAAHPNYLPITVYPLPFLPPFAAGNAYILSSDLVKFVANNIEFLRPVGSLEDISVAFWMLSLQVYPVHLPEFCSWSECNKPSPKSKGTDVKISANDSSPVSHKETQESDDANVHDRRSTLIFPDFNGPIAVAGLRRRDDFIVAHAVAAYAESSIDSDSDSDSSGSDSDSSGWEVRGALEQLMQQQQVLTLPRRKYRRRPDQVFGEPLLPSENKARNTARWKPTIKNESYTGIMNSTHNFLSTPTFTPSTLRVLVLSGSGYAIGFLSHFLSRLYTKSNIEFSMLDDTFSSLHQFSQRCSGLHVAADERCWSSPDVLVLGPLDGLWMREKSTDNFINNIIDSTEGSIPMKPWSWNHGANHSNDFISLLRNKLSPAVVIYINGEAVDLKKLTGFDILLSTVSDPDMLPQHDNVSDQPVTQSPSHVIAHIPTISTAIGEMEEATQRLSTTQLSGQLPLTYCFNVNDLLQPRNRSWAQQLLPSKQRGVAYLYSRCDREEREFFFKLLSDRLKKIVNNDNQMVVTMDALGLCPNSNVSSYSDNKLASNSNATRVENRRTDRFQFDYLLQAVEAYRPYRFVISFENSLAKGYVTEKVLLSYLAGAIPIYYGTDDISKYFLDSSMINCNRFLSLDLCAEFVSYVMTNEKMYLNILSSSIMTREQWSNLLAWHSSSDLLNIESIELLKSLKIILNNNINIVK